MAVISFVPGIFAVARVLAMRPAIANFAKRRCEIARIALPTRSLKRVPCAQCKEEPKLTRALVAARLFLLCTLLNGSRACINWKSQVTNRSEGFPARHGQKILYTCAALTCANCTLNGREARNENRGRRTRDLRCRWHQFACFLTKACTRPV